MVLTLVVMNELLTGHPVRALVSQQRLHPAGVVSVGAEDPSGEVTLGGGDIHAVIRDVPDRAAGRARERDMALLSECVCIHTPDSYLLTHTSIAVYCTPAAARSGGSHFRTRSML